MKRLKELMLKYNNFHVIIIDSQLFVTDCSHEDIESIVVMNEDNIDQLPPYPVIRNLIEGNYPSEKNFSDEELISMLLSIVPILGSDNYKDLSPRQHIFINLLNYSVRNKTKRIHL
ncbi:CRISPR-associated protein Csn2-St [Enterococcus cecorum]|nr:CRISPR-associated protein Csn2-St [Enterococcus cecorum]